MDKEKIRFFTIENAVKFNGKANPGAVIGKVLSEEPGLKEEISKISKEIQQAIKEINSMPFEEIKKEWEIIKPAEKKKEKEHKEIKKDLPELTGAVYGKVVTRMPPEPSKYSHLGHALSFLINYMYAQKYNGKCLLKLEDTNPEKCTKEYADVMIDDITNYLGMKPSEIIFISDDMDYMLEKAKEMIKKDKAYVCFCDRDSMQDKRHNGIECSCRSNQIEKNIELWKGMVARKYKEGECILRLKADMQSENQVMRDPVMFRISYATHFRHGDKYCVWPLYDFENSVEDCKYGVTHIMRSIEFGTMRGELQNHIKDIFGFRKQEIKEYGRFNIRGAITQGREIRSLIETGKVSGWDDPSLVTLRALKRRGIQKETFYELVYQVGLSPNSDKNIDWTLISSINRSILDPVAERYFFIEDPVEIKIENAPALKPVLKLHPDNPEKGTREFMTGELFYVPKNDFDKFEPGKLVRLMDCLNFEVATSNKHLFHSIEHEQYKNRGSMIIQWLPKSDNLTDIEVRMPDNEIKKGLGEPGLKNVKVGDVIQFTRFGFCRLDKIEKDKLIFWFTNK